MATQLAHIDDQLVIDLQNYIRIKRITLNDPANTIVSNIIFSRLRF